MKKTVFIFSALVFLIFTAFTGTGACDSNIMFVKGTTAKNGYYKSDGTLTGTATSTVTDVTTSGDSTIATLATSYMSATPGKDEKPHDGSIRFICVNGKLIMDMAGLMHAWSQAPGHSIKMVMTGNMVPYKTFYAAGEKLDDVKMNMQMFSDKSLMMTSDITITDRVCQSVEDLTTPAGTFHCYKISSNTTSVTKMGTMTMPGAGKPIKTVQWFSAKAGVVRMENFQSDTLSSYNELIELKKP